MGSHNHIYSITEISFASKVHTKAVLCCGPKSSCRALGYSFLKSSKDFIN